MKKFLFVPIDMKKLLRKTSFTSGLILLFAPIIFSSGTHLIFHLQTFLYTLDMSKSVYIIFLAVSILEIIFFVKILRAYLSREPYTYFIVYFLGSLTALCLPSSSILSSSYVKMILFFVLIFALFSFHYQRENFITPINLSKIRKGFLFFAFLAVVIAVAGFIGGRPLFGDTETLFGVREYDLQLYFTMAFLSALISLILVYSWRKKVDAGVLHSFIFFPAFQIIVTNLVSHLLFGNLLLYFFIFIAGAGG